MLTQEQLTQLNEEVAGLRPISPLPKYQVEEADSYAFTPEATKPAAPLPDNYQNTQVGEGFADLTFPSLTQENHTPDNFQEAFKENLPGVASFIGQAADRMETSVAANAISQMDEDNDIKTIEAWKVYTSTRPDVLREVRSMSIELGIPEKAILYSPDALNRTRNIYNYRRKQMALSMPGGKNDPGMNEVTIDDLMKAYPGLDKIIKSDSVAEAGIALENIENIRQMKGYLDAGIFGVKKGLKQREMQKVGLAAYETGRDVTEAELKRYRELEEEYKNMPEAPDFLDSPLVSLIGRTAEQLPQQAFGLAKGGAYGVAGAATAVLPTVALAPVTGGASMAATPAAAKYGFGIGMRVGYAEDMFTHSAAQRYIEYTQYKDENGKRVLTNAEAQAYASVAAAVETGIEFLNAETILKVLKGNKSIAAEQIRNIVTGAKDTASLIAGFKKLLSGAKTITLSEDIEEGAQEISDRLLSNVAHAIWGGNIPTYSPGEVVMGGVEAMANAFLPSLGFSVIAGGSGSIKLVRRAAAIAELNNEEFKGWWKNVNGLSVINQMIGDSGIVKFFKEDPEVAKKTLQGTVEGTDFENVNIDTEYARKKENGEEALREVGKAAGLSDETVQAAIDTNATLSVPTAVYFQTRATRENFALGDDVLTFSDEAPCIAREKEYEARKAQLDAIMSSSSARQVAQQTEAIDRVVKENFEDETDIELATAALMLNPRNPEKGWQEIRDDYQSKADAILAPIMETVRRMAPENVSDEEIRNTAMAILTGTYEGETPDYLKTPEMQEFFGANAVQMQALQSSMDRLDAIKEKIKSIDADDLQAMEGMSQAAYGVYRDLTNIVNAGAPNEKVKKSGQLFAALFARNADIYAASKRAEGNENYTAADYYREMFELEMGGEYNAKDNGGLFQVAPKEFNRQKEEVRKQHQGTDQWMKAPNGEDTNLSEDQWLTVRTAAFKNWFGDWENDPENASKVVDENGEPLVVYHGSDANFDTFDRTKGRANMDIQGSFFSPWKEDAAGYGENVRAFFLNIRKPANEGQGYKALNKYKGQNGAGIKAREDLTAQGFDGVNNENEEYIAFESNQIKDASGRNVTFNPETGNVYFQNAGENARNKNIDKLFKAMDMFAEDKPAEEIYKETGWFRGEDGLWRFEIPDNLDAFDLKKIRVPENKYIDESVLLSDVYNIPELYEAYPWLAETEIIVANPERVVSPSGQNVLKGAWGFADYDNNQIVVNADAYKRLLNNETETKSNFIHEIQHLIQRHEGFARGGAPETAQKQIEEQIRRLTAKITDIHPDAMAYYNFATALETAFFSGNEEDVKKADKDLTSFKDNTSMSEEQMQQAMKIGSQIATLKHRMEKNGYNPYLLYRDLAGEQEANATAERAERLTVAKRYEEREKAASERLNKEIAKLTKEQKEIWDKYVSLVENPDNRNGMSLDEYGDQLVALEQKLPSEIVEAHDDYVFAHWDREDGAKTYQEELATMPQPHDPFTAIVTYAGASVPMRVAQINEPVTPMDKLKADAAAWGEKLNELINMDPAEYEKWGQKNVHKVDRLMTTPLALQLAGMPAGELMYEGKFITHSARARHPGMNLYVLKQIPEALADPLMVVSRKTPNHYMAVVALKDKNKATVVVELEIRPDEKTGAMMVDFATDAYGKTERGNNSVPSYDWFTEQFKNDSILYLNKEKSTAWFSGTEPEVAVDRKLADALSEYILSDRIKTVKTEEDLAKLKQDNPEHYQDQQQESEATDSTKQEPGAINSAAIQGMTRRMENGKRVMNVFNSGNESTMVHELGHIFLMNLMDMAAMKNAPERIVKDLELVKKWLGWKPDQTDFTKEQHEKFAKGFEAYLMTGMAPSTGLKKVFRKFKKWLNRIYRDFLALGGMPSDDIQKVMGRMIASEEEVEEAFILRGSEFFDKSGATTQLDTASLAMYQRWKDEAQEYAEEKVLARAMNDLTEKRKKELESARQKLTEDIQAKLKEEPFYKAQALLEANPAMEGNFPAEQLGITYEEYQEQTKERGTLEEETQKLVDAAMQEIEDKMPVAEIKEAAERAVNSSEYRTLYLAFERRFIVEKQMRTERLAQGIEAVLDALEKEMAADEPDIAKLKDHLNALRAQTRWTVKEMNLINRMVLAAEQMAQKEAVAQAKETAAEKLAGEKAKAETKLAEVKAKAKEKLAGQKERAETKLAEQKAKSAENIEAQRERVRQGRETLKSTIKNFRELVNETREHVHVYRDSAFADRRVIRQYAEEKMAAMNIPDATNVTKWRNKDRTSGHQAAEALRKAMSASLRNNGTQEAQEKISKLWQEANDLKTQQLVYAEMAAIAQRNADIVRKKNARLKTRMKSIRKNNSVPVQERYMYHHGLFVLGLEKQDAPVPQNKPDILSMFQYYADDLSAYFLDEEGNVWLPDYLIAAMAGTETYKETGYKSLTMEQYGEFTDALDTIYRVGMDANKIKTVKDPTGQEVKLDVIIDTIAAETESRVYEIENPDVTNAGSPTLGQRIWNKALEGKVKLIKIESILEAMGPAAERYIYEPVNRARSKEMVMLEKIAEKTAALWSEYSMTEMSEMRSKKQFKFGTSVLTREEMMCVALNWGTEKNRQRVMDGFRVTEDTVMGLLANLTDKDWKVVEGMWELTNSFWDETVATEERVAGIAPKKEEAVSFTVMGNDGKIHELKGGYYHIKYDPSKSLRIANREQDDVARQNMRNKASMNRNLGFTKQRSSGPVEHPLLLSFDVFSKNLYDVVHNICFREALRDVRRIVTSDKIVNTITTHYGQYQAEQVQQWVIDCWAREKTGLGFGDQLMRFFRHKQTQAALGHNITTALLNVLNIFPMTHYLGAVRTRQAITDFYENREANWQFCLDKSPFLRERAETMDRDAGEVLRNEFHGGNGAIIDTIEMGGKMVSKSAFKVMALTDLMLANPLWLSEYQRVYQEMVGAAGPNITDEQLQRIEAEAISAGDKAVRKVFGSGDIKDLAPIQKGSELDKLLTMYYSYFNVVFNAIYSGYAEGRRLSKQNDTAHHIPDILPFIGGKDIKIEVRPVVDAILYWTVLTGVSEGILRKGKEVLTGNDDGEDGWLMAAFKGWRDNLFGTIPYVRDAFVSAMDIVMGERYYGARPLPAYQVVDNFQKLWNAITKDKKTKIDVFREGARLTNEFTGVSNTVTDAFATTAYWVDSDFDTPFYQYLAAVLLDRRIDKKKKKKK